MVYMIDVNLFYLTMPPIQNSFLMPQKNRYHQEDGAGVLTNR